MAGYYIIDEGTNLRVCTRTNPDIYDTARIAQRYIDDNTSYRIRAELPATNKRVPISIDNYRDKYQDTRPRSTDMVVKSMDVIRDGIIKVLEAIDEDSPRRWSFGQMLTDIEREKEMWRK